MLLPELMFWHQVLKCFKQKLSSIKFFTGGDKLLLKYISLRQTADSSFKPKSQFQGYIFTPTLIMNCILNEF